MIFGQAGQDIWDLVTNLAVIIGYLCPFLVIGWVARGWLSANYASTRDLDAVRKELEDFKAQVAHQDVTDAARHEKLEDKYDELLTLLSTRRSR